MRFQPARARSRDLDNPFAALDHQGRAGSNRLMRALVLEQSRQPLRERDLPCPQPGSGQVLVQVRACAVCRTDLHVVDGELPNPKLPLVPGHEIIGTVAAAGERVVQFAAGDRVGVPWLGYSCGRCRFCLRDELLLLLLLQGRRRVRGRRQRQHRGNEQRRGAAAGLRFFFVCVCACVEVRGVRFFFFPVAERRNAAALAVSRKACFFCPLAPPNWELFCHFV